MSISGTDRSVMADQKFFELEIISPDRIFYQGKASMVELNTSEGEIGVYKDHIPLTTILVPGIVTITEASGKKEAAVHAGFIEILKEKITILAEIAEWPEEIDVNRANEAKLRAERRIQTHTSDVNVTRAEMALRKALIRIELAGTEWHK